MTKDFIYNSLTEIDALDFLTDETIKGRITRLTLMISEPGDFCDCDEPFMISVRWTICSPVDSNRSLLGTAHFSFDILANLEDTLAHRISALDNEGWFPL